MNTKDKEILLKDLCARLPYGVKINESTQGDFTVIGLTTERVFTTCETEGCHNDFPIECIKPYLRPMSSMTDYEAIEWHKTTLGQRWITNDNIERCIDWVNAHHFDFRGLIEKGLAIDATGKKIY